MKFDLKALLNTYRRQHALRLILYVFLTLTWVTMLQRSDSYLSPYIFCALISILAFEKNLRQSFSPSKGGKALGFLFSLAFSGMILLANYRLIFPLNAHIDVIIVLFVGSFLIARNILLLALKHVLSPQLPALRSTDKPAKWFIVPMLIISAVNLLLLLLCYNPGFLSRDSMWQVEQILTGDYSNHHPYWHTMLIRVFVQLGIFLFHDINIGVLMYSIFQVLCMAAIFAFILMTMYQSGVSKGWIIIVFIGYAFFPYHIFYSMTMWKDILFGGSVALFTCVLYRMIKKIGGNALNYFLLALSALGSCLLRSNGFAAFVLSFVILAWLYGKSNRKMLFVLLAVIIASYILKHPVLDKLNVTPPDTIEHLSIPEQQIARLLVENVPLTDEELDMIGKIMDIEQVKTNYKYHISDPVKAIMRKTDPDYLDEHKMDYLLLWLRLGLKYPGLYIISWADQTMGYWNGGYEYWILQRSVIPNIYGIFTSSQSASLTRLATQWINDVLNHPAFQIFKSIGLHTWVIALCGIVLLISRKKEGVLCVLPLAVVASLLIATPVFSEFRYAYALFTTYPLILAVTFAKTAPAVSESSDPA